MAATVAKLLNHIRELPLSIDERNIAFLIASYRNDETFLCNPTQERLAELSGLKQQHVSKVISRLRKKKVLQSVGIETGSDLKKFRNHYAFFFDWNEVEQAAMADGFCGNLQALCGVGMKIRNGNGNRLLALLDAHALACKQKEVLTPTPSAKSHGS